MRRMRGNRGQAVVEAAFIIPFLVFLFIGAFDVGFSVYALIATENAARVAVEHTAKSSDTADDQSGACKYALAELNALPNVKGVTSCNSSPVTVTAAAITGPDGQPASSVTVTYQVVGLITMPGIFESTRTITRTAKMRLEKL